MTNTAKIWIAVVVIGAIGAIGAWVAYGNNQSVSDQASLSSPQYQTTTVTTTTETSTSSASKTTADQDMTTVDAQMNGLSSDNSNADQGLQAQSQTTSK